MQEKNASGSRKAQFRGQYNIWAFKNRKSGRRRYPDSNPKIFISCSFEGGRKWSRGSHCRYKCKKNANYLSFSIWATRTKKGSEKKDIFWQYLEEDDMRADNEGKGFILQGDLHSWLGKNLIPSDPRHQMKMED